MGEGAVLASLTLQFARRETIGGYILIEAADFDAAVAIAKANPMLPVGLTIEIRQVADNCPANRLAGLELPAHA